MGAKPIELPGLYEGKNYFCPCCNKWLGEQNYKDGYLIRIFETPKITRFDNRSMIPCPRCGIYVDWSEMIDIDWSKQLDCDE